MVTRPYKGQFWKSFKSLKFNLFKLDIVLQTTKPNLTLIQEKSMTFSNGQPLCLDKHTIVQARTFPVTQTETNYTTLKPNKHEVQGWDVNAS